MSTKKDPPSPGTGRKPAKDRAPSRASKASARGAKNVAPGDVLNHIFEVRRFIGRGGMGEVFEGINVNSEEPVAIKVILPHLAADPQVLAMFRKEALTLTRLSHPALVQYRVLAQEPQLGVYYIVTDFISGENLSNVLQQLDATPRDLAGLTRRLAEGLAAAHRLGAIHRDIAPDNIMLPGGRLDHARIIDFGIAKDLDASSSTIVGDGFAGKLNYVAPEQLGEYGRDVGPWSDVYSLALTILAVARKKDVDLGGSLVDAVDKRRKGVDVSAAPASLQGILGSMLKHDPAERCRSMEDVIAALDGLGQGWDDVPTVETPQEAAPSRGWGEVPPEEPPPEGAPSSLWGDLPSDEFLPGEAAEPAPISSEEGRTVFLPSSKPSPAAPQAVGGKKIFGFRPVIAGSILAGGLLVFAGLLWFAIGGTGDDGEAGAGQVVALSPEAQVAKATRLLGALLPAQECTSLTLGDVAYRDGGIAIAVGGIAGTAERSAAAQEQIARSLGDEGLLPKSLDFSAVKAIGIADCRPIDVFKRFASVDGPRLSFPQSEWEVQRLGNEGGSGREGQLGVKVEGEANLAGAANPARILFLGRDELHFDDKALADSQYAAGPDRYKVDPVFSDQELGWWAVVLLTGKEPFDLSILRGKLSEKADWSERFSETATAQGWTVEVVWMEVVDEIPN